MEDVIFFDIVIWFPRRQPETAPGKDTPLSNGEEPRLHDSLKEVPPELVEFQFRLYEYKYWLVPLAKEGSRFSVSVRDVFPLDSWDRSNNQVTCRRRREFREPSFRPARQVPITIGVARIRVGVASAPTQNGGRGRGAIVVFGLLAHESTDERDAGATGIIGFKPWCRLLQDESTVDLKAYFENQISVPDCKGHTFLTLDGVGLFHASVMPTRISGNNYDLIKLWMTEEGAQEGESA